MLTSYIGFFSWISESSICWVLKSLISASKHCSCFVVLNWHTASERERERERERESVCVCVFLSVFLLGGGVSVFSICWVAGVSNKLVHGSA